MRQWKIVIGSAFAFFLVVGGSIGPAGAAAVTQRVTESTLKDGNRPNLDKTDTSWYREDTRVGGGVTLSKNYGDPADPSPTTSNGAVVLTTNDKTTAKAQLETNQVNGTSLALITELSYDTYQDGTQLGFAQGEVAYQIQTDFNGSDAGGFTTLTYEPYIQDPADGTVTPNVWQHWNAVGGKWYTSRDITCPDGFTLAKSQGTFTTNPTELGTHCPEAKVVGLGINIGSNNPSYITAADGVHFATATDSFTADFGPK